MSEVLIPAMDRLKQSIAALVRELFPRVDFLGVYEYSVVTDDGTTIDATPTDATLGLPNVVRVPKRPPILGGWSKIAPGSTVTLQFVNGSPSRPEIVGGDPGQIVTQAKLEAAIKVDVIAPSVDIASGVMGAARMGDTVQAGPFVGTITSGSVKVTIG